MKIAIISLQYKETATGGGGVHAENITEQFLKKGHEVTIFSIHTEKTLKDVNLIDWYTSYSIEKTGKTTIIRFLIDKNIAQPYIGDKNVELRRIKRFADTIIKYIKEENSKFDIINLHGHHIIPGYIAEKLKGINVKIVSTIHALESTYVSRKGEALGSFDATSKILENLKKWESMSYAADYVIVNSEEVCREYKDILKHQNIDTGKYTEKVKIIASGVNSEFLMNDEDITHKLSNIKEPIKFVIFSRLDPSKGIVYSIKGIKKAALETDLKLNLYITGIPSSGDYIERIKSEIQPVPPNLEIKLKLLGSISSEEERKQILDDKKVYILSSLKEPFGMSIIEASARGNIIISTDTTGPKYMMIDNHSYEYKWGYITDFGILAKTTDNYKKNLTSNISESILWVLNNLDKCLEKVLMFNFKIRKKWTWDGISNKYIELFNQ